MIAGRILAARSARKAGPDLGAADASIGQARSAMAGHDYNATWRAARSAYESVLQGADRAGVEVTPSYNGWALLPKVKHKDRHESRNSVIVYGGFDKIGPGSKRAEP